MLVYWILFGMFAAGALFKPGQPRPGVRQSDLLLNSAAILTAVVIGLRYHVGADWRSYELMFNLASFASLERIFRIGDPGYQTINWSAAQIGAEIWLVNLICGAIFTWGLLRFAKAQADPWLAMLVAVPYLVIVVGMGYTRQAVAIGIIMAGLAAFQRGASTIRFAVYVAMAALFHKTAVVVLPIVLFATGRNRVLNVVAGAIAFFFLYDLFLAESVDRFVRVYIEAKYTSQGAAVRVAMSVVPAALFLLAQGRFGFSAQERAIWRLFSLAAFGFLVLLLVLPSSTAVDRLALYILPLQVAVLSRVPYGLLTIRQGTIAVVLYSFAVQFVWLNYAIHSHAWVPYQFHPL